MLFQNLFFKKQEATRQGELLKNPAQIIAILKQIADRRSPLTLSFKGIPNQFSSLLLRVKAEQQHFLLDELYPEQGHQLLLERKQVQIHTSCQGIPTLFESRLLGQGEQQGIAVYGLSLPQSILYQQRRQTMRIPVPTPNPFSLFLKIHQQPTAQGSLQDLSMHGVSAEFPGNLSPYLDHNGMVLTCILRISINESITCSLRIRNIKYHRQRHKTRIGGAFEDVDKLGTKMLNQLLLQIRRRQKAD